MKKPFLVLSALCGALILSGCSDNDFSPPAIAGDLQPVALKEDNIRAIGGETFTFRGGVEKFGTTGETTVQISPDGDRFAIEVPGGGRASGLLEFGSCIFKVVETSGNVPAALAEGNTIEVGKPPAKPCAIKVDTEGLRSQQNAIARAVSFLLEDNASLANKLEVEIRADGTVVVKGTAVGTVTFVAVTGS